MVVFQNYLLPGGLLKTSQPLTPFIPRSRRQKAAIVREHLALVGLGDAADKKAAATLRWDETAGFDRTGFAVVPKS